MQSLLDNKSLHYILKNELKKYKHKKNLYSIESIMVSTHFHFDYTCHTNIHLLAKALPSLFFLDCHILEMLDSSA